MKNLGIIMTLSLLWMACANKQEKLVKQIDEVTKLMQEEAYPSPENMDQVVGLYDKYLTMFPDSKEALSYMELKAKYLAANNKYYQAIMTYDELIAKFPEDDRSAEAVFMQAFIFENYIMDKVKAQERYSDFLKHYPNHELADDAQFSLENLALSDEELLKKLQELNQDSVVTEEVL